MTTYKQTELGMIPSDWEIQSMSNICDVRDGTHDSPKYLESGIPLVTSKNIVNGKLDFSDISFISLFDAEEINKRSKVDKGDILMSMIGTIGNAVLVKNHNIFCIKNVALFKPYHEKINNDFLVQFISSDVFKKILENTLDGGIQKFISLGNLRNIVIAIPKSKPEQTAIATALSDTDTLLTELEKLLAKKQAIKTATMQQLLTGKTRLPEFAHRADGTPKGSLKTEWGDIPEDWEVVKLGECVNIFDNQRIPVSASNRIFGNIPYYGANGIQDYVNGFTHDGEFVLVAEDGANDLINYPVQYTVGKIWVNNHAHVLQGKKNVLCNKFLAYRISSMNISHYLVGGTRAKLNGSTLKQIEILCPKYKEQTAIAQILSDMDSEITALQDRIKKVREIKQGMMQNLLTGKIRLPF